MKNWEEYRINVTILCSFVGLSNIFKSEAGADAGTAGQGYP